MTIQSSGLVEGLTKRLALEHLIGREPSTLDRVRSVLADELGHSSTGLKLVEKVIQGVAPGELQPVKPAEPEIVVQGEPLQRPPDRPHSHEAFVEQTGAEYALHQIGKGRAPIAVDHIAEVQISPDPTALSGSGGSPTASSTDGSEPESRLATQDKRIAELEAQLAALKPPTEPSDADPSDPVNSASTSSGQDTQTSDGSSPSSTTEPSAADLDAIADEQKAADDTAAGDDALDSIVNLQTLGANVIGFVVNNANFFQDDQDLDIWTNTTGAGAFVATVTVESVDILSNVIWLVNPIPTATVNVGYKLLMKGASGQPNTGLFGLRYYQVATNTGNWLNVQRSAFPGKYNVPTVAVNGPLTPALVRALESQRELSLGTKKADSAQTVAHSNVDVRNAWEQNALLVQRLDYNAMKGDRSADMLKQKAPDQIGGRENLVNVRALPGYLDYLALKNWSRVETVPVDFYSVGGQTLFPIYGQSGGLASSLIFYLIWMGQIVAVQTRLNAFASGIKIPKGIFGQ